MTHQAIRELEAAAKAGTLPNATQVCIKPELLTDEVRDWLTSRGCFVTHRQTAIAITIPDHVDWPDPIDLDSPLVISSHPVRI